MAFLPYAEAQNSENDSILLKTLVIQINRAGSDSPVPHSNLNADQIKQNYHTQDIPYLLSGTPSLIETSDAGMGVGYTGLRIRGSDPTRVNVTINGVPFNDAESQGVFWVNLPDLSSSASEIQVQRGVGTSTNGAGAFGASVNIDLSKVRAKAFADFAQTVGAFNTRKTSAIIGTGLLNHRISFYGRFSKVNSDGFVDRATVDMSSAHFSGTYYDDVQSLQVNILTGKETTYQAWNGVPIQYIENESLRSFNSAGSERSGSPHDSEIDNYRQDHYMAHYKRNLSPTLFLQVNSHYTRGKGYFEQYKADQGFQDYGLSNVQIGDTTLLFTDLIRRRWLDNHFYGTNASLIWNPSTALKATVSGSFTNYKGKHIGEIIWAEYSKNINKEYYNNNATKQDLSGYIKTDYTMSKHWLALVDLQVRRVNYQFLGFDNDLNNVTQTDHLLFFNPKAGLFWRINKQWQAQWYAGVANKEPNRDDYTQSTPNSRPRSERMLDMEWGIKRQGSVVTASLNAYWMQYQNQLVLNGQINDVGAYSRSNIPNSYRAGIELEATAKPISRLLVSGTATISRNKARSFTEYIDDWDTGIQRSVAHNNTDLAFSPNFSARVELQYNLIRKRRNALNAAYIHKYVGKQYLDNTSNQAAQLSAWNAADFRINYLYQSPKGQTFDFIITVQNLFDSRYESNGWVYRYVSAGYDARPDNAYTRLEKGDIYNQTGLFPQAGRHWMATVKLGIQ